MIRVLTEGKVTERSYLRGWVRRKRPDVHLDLADGGMTPDALVRRAKEHARQKANSKPADRLFDDIWCVFDTDEHRNLANAMVDARQSGIEVAVSNPCFELWLVLHVQEQTAHLSRHDARRRSHDLHLSQDKDIPETAWAVLGEKFETARERAQALDARHAGNDSPPRANPSTDVWPLVDRLRGDA